jgi:hypothetical protein
MHSKMAISAGGTPMRKAKYGAAAARVARGVRTLYRWRAVGPRRAVWRQIILPLVGHSLLALLFLVLLPTLLGGSLAMALHTVPALALLRQPSASVEQGASARA